MKIVYRYIIIKQDVTIRDIVYKQVTCKYFKLQITMQPEKSGVKIQQRI